MTHNRARAVPTLRAQWLGQQLRDLRVERGLTLQHAADYLQRNLSALSRFERAEWPVRRGDVLALMDLYGVTDERRRAQLTQLSEDVWRTDQWDTDFEDVIYDRTFIDYPWLESRASRICSFSTMVIPGLLQTREYAEAVIRNMEGPGASEPKVARWVDLRMRRQQVLTGKPPTRLAVILDEAVLRRPVGGAALMRAQFDHLLEAGRRAHIEIRVLSFGVGAHGGLDGTFFLFEMPKPYPEVAYVESLAGRLYIESPRTDRFVRAYDLLHKAALDPVESAKLITAAGEELK